MHWGQGMTKTSGLKYQEVIYMRYISGPNEGIFLLIQLNAVTLVDNLNCISLWLVQGEEELRSKIHLKIWYPIEF